jgi:carbamate kinase
MLTDVEHAFIDFGTENATPVGEVTVAQAERLAAEGHFLAGSMGPKVASAIKFVEGGGMRSIITSLDKAADGLAGNTGTIIVPG